MFKNCLACFASSVDGKITAARSEGEWVKLGNPKDLERLFTLRDSADVICFGASTFRAWPGVRRGLNGQNIPSLMPARHVIFTRSWMLPWESDLFTEWADHPDWPPILIASPSPMPLFIPDHAREVIEHIHLNDQATEAEQLQQVKESLDIQDNQTVMLEGGGELFSFFLKAEAVTELHLTMTPQLIGGTSTPSLVAGDGFRADEWPVVAWTSVEHHPPELYLTGRCAYLS
jgi:riboflavin biosynthesis pyrimidine reductase